MSTQALATRGEQPLAKNDIRALLQSEKVRDQIELALPKHMSPDRMMRVALTAINKNPKLLECTQESILLSLMTCSQYGIEPDGRNAHLIPYRNSKKVGDRWEYTMECQFQWDYKGLVAQIRKSPEVKDIYADYICKNDTYKVTRGLHRDLIHEFDIQSDRGPVIAFYSVCLFKDGTASFEIMTVDEVESIRLRSKSTDKQTGKSTGAWLTDYTEMGKKTAIKRHSKMLPLPTEIALAVAADNDFDDIPKAQVTEIKKASVPGSPALQESSQQPADPAPEQPQDPQDPQDPQQPAAAEEQPELKPAKAREVSTPKADKKKLKRKTAPPAEDGPKATLVAKTRKALEEGGFNDAQLVKVMIKNEWGNYKDLKDDSTVSDLDETSLESLFEDGNWEIILSELKEVG